MTIADGTITDPNRQPLPDYTDLFPRPVLQLYAKEAASGKGGRMHGFSGSPCLVDGVAVGILRSMIACEEIDGARERRLYAEAGTLYATPAQSVVEFQRKLGKSVLPGSWAPPQVEKIKDLGDLVVLLSQREPNPVQQDDEGQQLKLREVVREAYLRLQHQGLSEPVFLAATEAFSSAKQFEECVRALCCAKIVVFDATDFEPAIMFLAGIRAVVRRGVTLLSIGDKYALGKQLTIPFNVTDANIVAHSYEQDQSRTVDSVSLLAQRVERGLDGVQSTQYLDLPVYDAIRRLSADRRGIIPSSEGALVLCSFGDHYEEVWEKVLQPGLDSALKNLRTDSKLTEPASFGVSRSFELNSPQLVSHAVYEAIRRVQLCVVDLSGWSPNVLFELGVRLAASGWHTACIIEEGWEKNVPKKEWLPQCRTLVKYLINDGFTYNPKKKTWIGQEAFRKAYSPDALPLESVLLKRKVHELVEDKLDIDSEPASRPVFLDLLDQAATFLRDPGPGGNTKPVGLFPGNAELPKREEAAEFDRLFAAWLYLSNRFTSDEILGNATIRDATYKVIQSLFERHAERLGAEFKNLVGDMGDMMDKIDDWRTDHARSTSN